MNGKILDYNSEFKSGLIRGNDGNKYRFSIDDCKSVIKPRANAEVDFEPSGDKAAEVYVMTKDTIDDLKDVASSAGNATAYAAKVVANKSKKLIPLILGLILIVALAGFIVEQLEEQKRYAEQLEKQQVAMRLQNDIDHLMKVAEDAIKAKKYQLAISKIVEAKELDPDILDPWPYDSKIAIIYLNINEPDKALSSLGSTYGLPIERDRRFDDRDGFLSIPPALETALGCIIASKAYKMKGDLNTAEFYANLACVHGDCSLVEK